MFLRRFALVGIVMVLAACGSQDRSEQAGLSPGQKAQVSGSKATLNGCTIDAVKVCQAYIDQAEIPYNSELMSWQKFAQVRPPHTEVILPASFLDKSLRGGVECYVSTSLRK